MSLKNVELEPRFTHHLISSKAFNEAPLVVVDVGARGGFEKHWDCYGDQVELIGFEADVSECERLNQQAQGRKKHFYPFALHRDRDKKTFYVTAYPSSSGFYPVDMEFWQRFVGKENLSIIKTLEIDTLDLDTFVTENKIDYVDFIKLDTEGSELDILKGATKTLEKSVLGLSVEVEFSPIHKGQPLFCDVDNFLRKIGFNLFDLEVRRYRRKSLLEITSQPSYYPTRYGQVILGQALYLRDGVNDIQSSVTLEDGWDNIKVLKLASIMELFCLPDCAIELIQTAQQRGFLEDKDNERFIDMLVPKIGNKIPTYQQYMGRVEVVKRRGYVNSLEHSRQLAGRSLPQPIRQKVYGSLIRLRDLIDGIVKG